MSETLDCKSFVWNGKNIKYNPKAEESVRKVADYLGVDWIRELDGNIIFFPEGYEVVDKSLRYIGHSKTPTQPIGLTNYDKLFLEWEGDTLDLSSWDVSSVTVMSGMFYQCESLINLNISNWNVSHVTTMERMFDGCISLTKLNLSGWNVESVRDMSNMFAHCNTIKSLNLNCCNVWLVRNTANMFESCKRLKELYLPKWNSEKLKLTANMFLGSPFLENRSLEYMA